MITIVKVPTKIAYADNPLYVKVNGDSFCSNVGSIAFKYINFTAPFVAADTVTFFWGNNTVVFTAAQYPNNSGNSLPDNHNSASLSTYVELIRSYLVKNYLLSTDFDILISSDKTILIRAKNVGANYSLTINSSRTGIFSTLSTNVGVDQIINPYYKILMQVLSLDATNLNHIDILHEEALDVDENGDAITNIQDILRTLPVPGFTPDYDGINVLIPWANACKWVGVRFAEQIDSNTIYGFTDVQQFKIIRGGIDKLSQALALRNNLVPYVFIPGLNFLTNKPDNMKIRADQPERLFFILPFGSPPLSGTYYVIVQWETHDIYGAAIDGGNKQIEYVSPGDYFEFIVTPQNLGIDLSNTNINSIKYWAVDVHDTIIAGARTYIVDRDINYNQRYIIFRNSYGAYDCVVMTGRGLENADYTFRKVVKQLPAFAGITDAEKQNDRNSETKTLTLNTGWVSLAVIYWLRDLALSNEIYVLLNGVPVQYICTSAKLPLRHDNDYMYNQDFEFELANDNNKFSENRVIAALVAANDSIVCDDTQICNDINVNPE